MRKLRGVYCSVVLDVCCVRVCIYLSQNSTLHAPKTKDKETISRKNNMGPIMLYK
jgi:hypothetical protein